MSKPLLGRLSARQLGDCTGPGYFAGLRCLGLAQGPEAAVDRIVAAYGVRPDRSGSNVPGIVLLRDALWKIAPDPVFAFGLAVVAPHTHWDGDRPIILSREASSYRIGHQALGADCVYTPVSFLLAQEGPLPYEWVDDTVEIDTPSLERAFTGLELVCRQPGIAGLPLGLSLNFRFKDLFAEEPITTVEFEESHFAGDAPAWSRIVKIEDVPHAWANPAFGQVAWHAFSDREFDLSRDGAQLLGTLRARLGTLRNPAEAEGVLSRARALLALRD